MRILFILVMFSLAACTYNPEKADMSKLGRVLSNTGRDLQYHYPRQRIINCYQLPGSGRTVCS